MQTITVEHRKTITNDSKQKVVSSKEPGENMRKVRSAALSTSRRLSY